MKLRKLNKRKKHLLRVLRQDQDHDFSYIYILLKTKLENVLEYMTTQNIAIIEDTRLLWLKRSVNLLDILIKESAPEGFKVNIQNRNRFGKFRPFATEDKLYTSILSDGSKVTYLLKAEKINEGIYEDIYLEKAKRLLFKILTNYINYWWV